MRTKRNKFLTFVFSMVPGAGHMFMGFMKRGLSIMLLFFSIAVISSALRIGIIGFILPVIWFYGFFDCLNISWADNERFMQLPDEYLFGSDLFEKAKTEIMGKYKLATGIILVLLGGYLLLENVFNKMLGERILGSFYHIINNIISFIPQLGVSALIIFIGIKLISGKKKELDKNE